MQPWNQKMFVSWQESYDKPRQCVEKQRQYSNKKGPYSQGYGLPSDHVWLWQLDSKEGEAPKNWVLQTVVLEKTPECPLDSKKIKTVNLKGNQPWILVGRTDAKTETPAFWSSDTNSWLTGKVPDVEKKGIRGWDAWMALPMQWTWSWAIFRRWWGTGRPGMLQSMGLNWRLKNNNTIFCINSSTLMILFLCPVHRYICVCVCVCVCVYTQLQRLWLSLVAQRVKRLPAMRETWVRSLGGEDPLEKEMVTHSSILAWKTPWMEKPGGLQPMESQRVGHGWAISL